MADGVENATRNRHRLAGENRLAVLARDLQEIVKHAAFDRGGVVHPDHQAGQHGFEHARRSEVEAWPDLAQILLDRLGTFGARHAEACDKALRVIQIVVTNPCERQVGKRHIVFGELIEFHSVGCGVNAPFCRQHDAFRSAGCAGGVENDRCIGPFTAVDQRVELRSKRAVCGKRRAAVGDDVLDLHQAAVVVVAQAADFVVNDRLQMRQALQHRQHLVNLLLILRRHELHVGVAENVGQLVRNRVRIDRHRNRAHHLCGHHGPVHFWTIGADDGDRVALLQP